MPRNTSSGLVLENMVLPALKMGGYQVQTQVVIGMRMGVGKHKVDVVARSGTGDQVLISLKWQQSSGTAEDKVPFEVLCLREAVTAENSPYRKAYLVLGGEGWTRRSFFIKELEAYLPHREHVIVITLEGFIALANRGRL